MSDDISEVLTAATVDVVLAGRVLGISRNTAYKAARDGSLPVVRVGAQYRVPTAKLREMLGLSPHLPASGPATVAA